MNKIGIVTSGGDAPGMNAAIRAITRVACSKGVMVLGFERGWDGVITNTFTELTPRNVGGILHLGGTILRTSRSPNFRKHEGVKKAAKVLEHNQVDGLITIGGDGSMRGALELCKVSGTKVVGIPATIDNDVYGTEESIGFDTAVNTAIGEIDKIRDTANALERIFVVEVMGRKRGFLALTIGLTVGAEVILVPEVPYTIEDVVQTLETNRNKGKRSGIIVAAEGIGDTYKILKQIEQAAGMETRMTIMGYSQRGGSPTARSRLLANLFAEKAVELLINNQGKCMVGLENGEVTCTDLKTVCNNEKMLNLDLLKLAKTLAT
ncbi:MAG: 6-phosphofructokinase [Candidatus Bathyarchaeota archaeon]|nr:6-phosphofructokinase [Candidatus Bathyarchaeota archaeon]